MTKRFVLKLTNNFCSKKCKIYKGELRYGIDFTGFETYVNFGINLWTSGGDLIDILPDTIWVVEDLTFRVANQPTSAATAWHNKKSTLVAAKITINEPVFNGSGRTTSHKKKTIAHELGHSLGIGDHYSDNYEYCIMYGISSQTNSLHSHDITDYNSIH